MCDHTRFIGLRAVDAHNQPVLGPNGIRATCATWSWRFGGAAQWGRERSAGLGTAEAVSSGRLTPCPQDARTVSSAPPPAAPGWRGERSRPSPVDAPNHCEHRCLGPAAKPPGAGKSRSLGDERGGGAEPTRCFAAPPGITAHAVARCRGWGLLALRCPQSRGLLRPPRLRFSCWGEDSACRGCTPLLPPSPAGYSPKGTSSGCRGTRSGGSLGPGCGQRPPDPHVSLGAGSPLGKRVLHADDKHINAEHWSYL